MPYDLVEPADSTVQAVRPVVDRELIGLAVEREASLRDAVGISAHDGPEVGRIVQIARKAVEAEDDVAERAVPVRCPAGRDDPALPDHPRPNPVGRPPRV